MAEGKDGLVSIIVPVYNVEPYLCICLDSLVGQTYEQIEILVDDGSTDGSGRICDAYAGKDDRIRVCHKRNQGVSAARNTGIEMAGGEYLVFVDSDDCVHRQLVELYMTYVGADGTFLCDSTLDIKKLKTEAWGRIFLLIWNISVMQREIIRLSTLRCIITGVTGQAVSALLIGAICLSCSWRCLVL